MEVFLNTDIKKILEIEERPQTAFIPYWTAEAYGFGKYIRKYGFYPKSFPLLIFTDHSGPSLRSKLNYYEVNNNAPVIMFHSPELVKKWKSQYKQKCYNLYSPFVFYRRKNSISISPEATGTLAYPVHSMPELDDGFDIEKYIDGLMSLPDKFHPISVSMHYHDLNIGRHEIFLRRGIRVFTAGNPHDYRFPQRFYSILRNFRYATSNFVGSALFYAVEMDIPFFIYGNEPEYKKNVETELAQIALESAIAKDEIIDYYTNMFNKVSDTITNEQKFLVESTLGLYDGISRIKMSQILYSCYLRFRIHNIINKGKKFLSARAC